jgi:hypothetical protein
MAERNRVVDLDELNTEDLHTYLNRQLGEHLKGLGTARRQSLVERLCAVIEYLESEQLFVPEKVDHSPYEQLKQAHLSIYV